MGGMNLFQKGLECTPLNLSIASGIGIMDLKMMDDG